MKNNKTRYIDYFLMTLLLFVSGNPLFTNDISYMAVFVIALIFFVKRYNKVDKYFILFVLFLGIVFFSQYIVFDFFPTYTISGVFIRVFIAFFILKTIGNRFINSYLDVLYFLAIISLVIFLLVNTLPGFHSFLLSLSIPVHSQKNLFASHYSIVFYTLYNGSSIFYRNPGPFWEPGAFGGYLMLGLIFNYYKSKTIFDKRGVVLLLALLSTTSTTAYIALFVFLFFILAKSKVNLIYKFFALLFVISLSVYLYTNVEFLGRKINSQLESTQSSSIYTNTNSQRFLSVLRDLNDIKGHYVWGRGPNLTTRYSVWNSSGIRTNGLTDFWVRYGSLFLLFSFFYLFKSFQSLSKYYDINFTYQAIFILIIVLQSEVYLNFPLFFSLFFLQGIYSGNKQKQVLVKK